MDFLHNIDWLLVSIVGNVLQLIVIIVGIFVVRGFMTSTMVDPEFNPSALTGREREEIRRRATQLGNRGVSVEDTLNLLYTFRLVEIGQYTDEDIYVPDDPYEDI